MRIKDRQERGITGKRDREGDSENDYGDEESYGDEQNP